MVNSILHFTFSILHSFDAFLNGDTNAPINAQIRLCRNGDFTTRSNDMLRVYRRVNPADWDGDGLANVIDAAPKASDGYCFGTGVDWLNANCGGVLSASIDTNGEIVISWNYGINPDAYYWLTFTSLADNNLISIACDGPSNLGDLTVIANSNQVCQVPLLVGASYHVAAEGPLSEVSASDQNATIEYNDPQQPGSGPALMMFACGQPQEGTTSDFYVDYNLNISFTPNGAGFCALGVMPKNPGVSLDDISGCCCSSEATTNGFTWTCSDSCTCGSAGHQLAATVSWEGYTKVYWYESQCGCAYDAPPPVPQQGPYAASVSVSFDKGAIIFEDAYENLPGVWVGRRSTSAHLTIHANGGPNGGVLTVTSQNLGKLQKNSGPAFPTTPVAVPAGHSITYVMNYVGSNASSYINDIVVTGTFLELGGSNIVSSAHITDVAISLSPQLTAPQNTSPNRHVLGIGEEVNILRIPSGLSMSVLLDGSDENVNLANTKFWCPWGAGTYDISVAFQDVALTTPVTVYEPSPHVINVEWNGVEGTNGVAGQVVMNLDVVLEPRFVSFIGIYMVEVPDEFELCPHNGYFSDETVGRPWSHTTGAGAGVWLQVRTGNEWARDQARRHGVCPEPWSYGWKEWDIPVGWGQMSGTLKGQITPNPTTQRFEIDPGGTVTVRKYGHWIKRDVDNKVWLDGNRVN